jgi:hypothetical protein
LQLIDLDDDPSAPLTANAFGVRAFAKSITAHDFASAETGDEVRPNAGRAWVPP